GKQHGIPFAFWCFLRTCASGTLIAPVHRRPQVKSLIGIAIIAGSLAVVGAGRGSLLQSAPPKAAARINLLQGDSEAARAGAKVYARECGACHGADREGHRDAPPLNRPDVQNAAPGALFWVLRNGSPRRDMPSFAHLPEAQRWQIVTFLQRATPH